MCVLPSQEFIFHNTFAFNM